MLVTSPTLLFSTAGRTRRKPWSAPWSARRPTERFDVVDESSVSRSGAASCRGPASTSGDWWPGRRVIRVRRSRNLAQVLLALVIACRGGSDGAGDQRLGYPRWPRRVRNEPAGHRLSRSRRGPAALSAAIVTESSGSAERLAASTIAWLVQARVLQPGQGQGEVAAGDAIGRGRRPARGGSNYRSPATTRLGGGAASSSASRNGTCSRSDTAAGSPGARARPPRTAPPAPPR